MDKPTLPKGTRDFGPATMARRQFIFATIRQVFEKYGFQPLETPALENLSTLTGKYGEEGDQLLFKILNSGDFLKEVDPELLVAKDSRPITHFISEKGLRYDLTVPFARYVVMNRHEIAFPFKRYQMQPVWRADRPQKGRYREFYQCDADVVGTDSLLCEAEIIMMIREVFRRLGLSRYTIKLNHRALLSGLAELAEAKEIESSLFVALDKLDKVGVDKVKEELRARGVQAHGIERLFSLLNFSGSTTETLDYLQTQFENSPKGRQGLHELREVLRLIHDYGEADTAVAFDLSLARGLSYYTGCIFEVKIHDVAIGSVSGGGRYDNLTGVFGLPGVSGVGISFGVDRLYDALEELDLFPKAIARSTRVLLAHFDDASRSYALTVAARLRSEGISTEVYPDLTKIKKQLEYADRKKVAFTVVIGSDEMATGQLTLKHMETGDQTKVTLEQLLQRVATA